MKIIRETAEELVIYSSARTAKVLCVVAVGVGTFIILGVVVPFAQELASGESGGHKGVAAFLIACGLAFASAGVIGLFRAQDTAYHFEGKPRRLVVRGRDGERVIPFAMIEEARVVNSGDSDSDSYGLHLILRADPHDWEISQVRSGFERTRIECATLAERINLFLGTDADRAA